MQPAKVMLGSNRVLATAVGFLLGASAFLSVTTAPASAGSVSLLFVPPFGGVKVLSNSIVKHTGCGTVTAHWSVKPRFNLTSGYGRVAGNGSASACNSTSSSVNLSMAAQIGFEGANFSVSTGGSYQISATWRWASSASVSIAASSSSTQGENATFEFFGAVCLVDYTTGNRTCSGGFGGGVSAYAQGLHSWTINVTQKNYTFGGNLVLTAGDSYGFFTDVRVGLWIHLGYGSTSGKVSFDMATGNEHARLMSLSVS